MTMTQKHASPWVEREDFGAVTVARLKTPSALDDHIVRAAFDPIYSLVDDVGRSRLVLNLAAADTLPSMALGKLVMLNRKVQAAKGRLALCHLTPDVHNTLATTYLLPLFNTYPTEQDAVASFAPLGEPEA
jgi:anti-sigma B factor antagonist